jgi:hypothetical protein
MNTLYPRASPSRRPKNVLLPVNECNRDLSTLDAINLLSSPGLSQSWSSSETTKCYMSPLSAQQPRNNRPSPSVIAVAVVQFVGSVPVLCICGYYLWETVWFFPHEFARAPARYFVFLGLPFLFSLVAAASSIGLLRLRGWARTLTLCLATLPVSSYVLDLIFDHPLPGEWGILPVAKILIAILAPVSIWWWALFTRPSVRSQFRVE